MSTPTSTQQSSSKYSNPAIGKRIPRSDFSQGSSPASDCIEDVYPPEPLTDKELLNNRKKEYVKLLNDGKDTQNHDFEFHATIIRNTLVPVCFTFPRDNLPSFLASIPWKNTHELVSGEKKGKSQLCVVRNIRVRVESSVTVKRANVLYHILSDYGLIFSCTEGCIGKNKHGEYGSIQDVDKHYDNKHKEKLIS